MWCDDESGCGVKRSKQKIKDNSVSTIWLWRNAYADEQRINNLNAR